MGQTGRQMARLLSVILVFTAFALRAQYQESFTGQNGRGLVDAICPAGTTQISNCGSTCPAQLTDNTANCTAPPITFSSWYISRGPATPYFTTPAGVGFEYGSPDDFGVVADRLQIEDSDNEFCWYSPVLQISGAGAVTISVDVSQAGGLEAADYVKGEYSINGGTYTSFGTASGAFAATVFSASGITGVTLQIRMCATTDEAGENIFIDNISVPQTGVTLVCTPVAFNVTGTAAFCSGGTGTPVGLSGSQPGFTYQLFRGANALGTPMPGTGEAISFGNQSTPGTYTVVATNVATPACTAPMTGSAVLTQNPTPDATATPSAQTICSGNSINTIILNSSVANTTFNWTRSNTALVTGISNTGTGNISGTLTNTSGVPATVTFTITPSTASCVGSDITASVQLVSSSPTLVCNDLTHVSLNENCNLELNPDDILEGTYACYEDYRVEIDRTLPLGNGPWQPAILGPNDVQQTYVVQVTHLVSNNKCWGNIIVEDKLPPVFEHCGCVPTPQTAFTGSIDTDDPVFERPLPGLACGSSFNTSFYDTYTFEVHTAGLYKFAQFADGGDGFGVLYAGSFDPLHPCMNFIEADDDDNVPPPVSQGDDFLLNVNLTPGTYVLVVTAFSGNVAYGAYTVSVSGPAPVTAGDNCLFNCGDKEGILNGSIAVLPAVANDNCSAVTLTKSDVYQENGACGNDFVFRTWTATDASGNSSQCTQTLTLTPYTLDNVTFPADLTLECQGCGLYNTPLPCNETGIPVVPGHDADGLYELIQYDANCNVLSEGLCNLGAQYEDIRLNICSATFNIIRRWTVIDWCTNTVIEHDQLIKVLDDEGPVINGPADMTVSTNPSQCCVTVNLPNVIVEDACSATANATAMVIVYDQYLPDQVIGTYNIPGNTLATFLGNNFWDCDTLARYGTTPCLPLGTHQVMLMAQDVCGNSSTYQFSLTVIDDVAPVATCTQFTTVAIGVDDPTDCYESTDACESAGVTWVPASVFNQGSYDNCNSLYFTVRRMPEVDGTYSDCVDNLAPLCDGQEYNVATTENDSIKFYCCEVGTTQTVILRVYQQDINGNISLDMDGNPIFNECMVNVEVQDKIKPACQAPAAVTVSCDNFDPSLWSYGTPFVIDNCCLDETPPVSGDLQGQTGIPAGTTTIPNVCGATQKIYYNGFLTANFDTTCNRGIIIRRFTAWDCQGQSSSCTQRITVTYNQDYNLRFPADVSVNCVTTPSFGAPVVTNDEGCELIAVSYNDVVFTIVPDACYKIERTWRIINWCTYNPDQACYAVPRNALNPITGLAPGRDWRVADGLVGQPNGTTPTNYADDNCITYKQIIKVKDLTPSTIACQDIDTCDYSTNNPRYWNDGDHWWDNGTMLHDLCEMETDMGVTATDFCDTLHPSGGLRFRYLLFMDLDGNGTMETVVSSADLNTRPLGQVRYSNSNNPNYGGGALWSFDNNTSVNQRYRFDIEQTANGARVIWRNASGVKNPELAHGRHKIKWIAEDGCGNEAVCEKVFTIRDCKPPVVACEDVNISLMIGGTATLWATDFFLYGDDNCTPTNILNPTLAVIRADENPGNTYPLDRPQSVIVTCTDFATGQPVPVQIWLMDAAGNAEFCLAYVIPQSNLAGCENDPNATVAGLLATETLAGVEDARVELAMTSPTGQQGVLTQLTDETGDFHFINAVQPAGSYTLTPTKDDNPTNGLTTYDLVLISKHILGLEVLNSPYKMIAADANRSGSVTTFDIVEFRKLILGIYTHLPNNTSWRFVDKDYVFPNPSNPFAFPFPENISVQNVQGDHLNDDFVGVKIGDVNNTVIPNALQSVDDRAASTMLFDVEDMEVKTGETFTLHFKGDQRVQGYQFTMNFPDLEVVEITPGKDMTMQNFAVFEDALTTSVDAEAHEFAVVFRAKKAGTVSRMLSISSRITKAEAYGMTGERMDVAFRYNNQHTSTIAGVGFEVYQNQPNPFINSTFIGFHLPEATEATLKVYDETGRMILSQSGAFGKGYNTFLIEKSSITTGVLYYTVETTTDSATRKMIRTK